MTPIAGTVEVRPGVPLWWSGEAWVVEALNRDGVVLASGDRRSLVGMAALAAEARALPQGGAADASAEGLGSAALASLPPSARAEVHRRARVVAGLLAAPTSKSEALLAAAEELGVTDRTLRRLVRAFQERGIAGLIDSRDVGGRPVAIDPRWDATCLAVLRSWVNASTPTRSAVIAEVERQLVSEYGVGVVPVPSRATAYRRLEVLGKGRHAFGSGKARRSVAARPSGALGRLRADRPGQFVVLDTTPLDVFAMEPVTCRWVPVQLTVAMDLFSRCILGLRVTPLSTKAADVASVLYQCVRPQETAGQAWPFHGVPSNVLVGTEVPDGVHQERVGGRPAALPETIVVDHGRQYLSGHVIGACARLGICVQPAIPNKPTDKPTVERFFRTVRESLLQHLPGYKGPDVFSRGKDVEAGAFYYVTELEQILREWVGEIYHHSVHAGLALPELPGARFTPAQMFELGLTRAGGLALPSSPDLALEFLDVAWRHIHHYGVEVGGLRYDGPGLNDYRGVKSDHGGAHRGKWPIHVDALDVRRAWFKDPADGRWHELVWEHAAGLNAPFSAEAVAYAKQLATERSQVIDPAAAVTELLAGWKRGEVTARRDRNLAKRLAAHAGYGLGENASEQGEDEQRPGGKRRAREAASVPGVVDLLARRAARAAPADDLDVFEKWEAGEAGRFEVFDE